MEFGNEDSKFKGLSKMTRTVAAGKYHVIDLMKQMPPVMESPMFNVVDLRKGQVGDVCKVSGPDDGDLMMTSSSFLRCFVPVVE